MTESAPLIPSTFKAFIGGYFAQSYQVELLPDGKVLYQRNYDTFHDPFEDRIEVPQERWDAFRSALDDAGVWGWQAKYMDSGICDGTQWEVEIVYPDGKFECFGSNDYPPKKEFERFLRAVSKLLGGLPFK